ncbi:MAG TPA: ATP-binding protein [Verrucomicrobiae bacterium]
MREVNLASVPRREKRVGSTVTKLSVEYAFALLAVGLASLARLALDAFCGESVPYATFYLSFIGVIWVTGMGPAVAALAASLLVGNYFFVAPRYTLGFETIPEWLAAGLFTFVCVSLLVLVRKLRQNEHGLRASRAHVEQALAQLNDAHARARLLAETASQLLRASDPQQVVDALCSKVMTYLGCDVFFNFLVDPKARHLRLNACAGISRAEAAAIETLEFGAAVCGCAARDGCRIVAEDILHTPDPRTELVKSLGVQAYACHPLKVQGRVLGTLSFGTRSRTQFDEGELSLMLAVTDLVAIAMERQQSAAELQQMNQELEQRVRERTRSLEEMTEHLNAFCHSVAHDLRAPLRTQIGFAELLLEEYANQLGPDGRKYAELVLRGAERQDHIIADLLAHIKVSLAEMPVEPVSLPEAIAKARADLAFEVRQKDAIIEDRETGEARVKANSSSLHLVILNLLTNACKFVPAGTQPHVRLWTSNGGGFVRLWVEDNGIGIDPLESSRLFGMFQRLNRSRKYPGTGMGLAIVKKAVERMGGQVGAESEPGKGSRFWVELPAAN